MNAYLLFFAGLAIITIGSEFLLRGASRIACLLGIRPIIIGLTVVSIGTSLPEFAVGLTAIKDGATDMAIGNIAGTNLVNILLILGLSAIIRPLPLQLNTIKSEVFAMIFAALLLLVMCIDGLFSFWDGLILFILGIAYLFWIVRNSKKESKQVLKEYKDEYQPPTETEKKDTKIWILNLALLVIGIASTIVGADLLVSGATKIAKAWGMSDAVIGLTIVAIGTSAPELVTTLVATFKNERDVAIGNLLGSSIMNILIILAATVLFVPEGIKVNQDLLWFDLPLAAFAAILCYPVFKSDHKVSRTEGIVFVSIYIVYLVSLIYWRT